MPYNSNTLFQKMPDKVSFFYAQISEKWLELFLKKFPSYTFRNNVESETVLYLTNGRKRIDESRFFLFVNRKKSCFQSKTLSISTEGYCRYSIIKSPSLMANGLSLLIWS